MMRKKHVTLMVLFTVILGLTLAGIPDKIAPNGDDSNSLLLRDARVKMNINSRSANNPDGLRWYPDESGSPPSIANLSERVDFFSKDVLSSLINHTLLSMSQNASWMIFNLSDLLRLNITITDVTFINVSEVVREIHPTKGYVRPTGINDVYIVKGSANELTSNEHGHYQFIFTRTILFGSISLESKNVWIDPIKKTSISRNSTSKTLASGFKYKLRIIQKKIQKEHHGWKYFNLKTTESISTNVNAASTKNALVVAAGTGSFYNEWGDDIAAAILYNIDGADQYTWVSEGSYLVPKDANDVFNHYFGLTLNIKRMFYWPVGGPGNDPNDCFKLANATADFIRSLSSSDPVFPFHLFVMFSGRTLENSFGQPVQGCVIEGNTRIKYVSSPNDLPNRESVPIAVVQSRSSDSGHLRRFTTAHEIGHLLGGTHNKADSKILINWLFSVTGTWCDNAYDDKLLILFANTLMYKEYSGTVVCIPFWVYSDFFITSGNQQQMKEVISNVVF